MRPSARTTLHLGALLLASVLACAAFPTTHGLTNWQEAQRAVVAREMHARAEWLVPFAAGHPYLAKPPMIYWAQLLLARARGGPGAVPDVFDLRLTVALAGIAGVLATYAAGRALFAAPPGTPPVIDAPRAAFWAALLLASGVLYIRSSRIGELDILLAPATALGVAALAYAWRLGRARPLTRAVLLAAGTACAVAAALTKGPPGVLTQALAVYGGVALSHAWSPLPGEPTRRSAALGAGAIGAIAFVVPAALAVRNVGDAVGASAIGAIGFGLGATLARLAPGGRWRTAAAEIWRLQPLLVLGIPAVALWLWTSAVTARLGPAAVAASARGEADDNLRLFVPGAPLANLEAASYAVGLGSALAVAAAVWVLRDRPSLPRTCWVVLAWVVLPLAAFSVLSKGVPRYLTPAWPGIALAGGLAAEHLVRSARRPGLVAGVLAALAGALGAGQGAWYALGRERFFSARSPRDLIGALLARPDGDPSRLALFEFYTPAVDFYAGEHVEPFGPTDVPPSLVGVRGRSLDELRDAVLRSPLIVLVREDEHARSTRQPPALERLGAAGFVVEPIDGLPEFRIDSGRTRVRAVRVTAQH